MTCMFQEVQLSRRGEHKKNWTGLDCIMIGGQRGAGRVYDGRGHYGFGITGGINWIPEQRPGDIGLARCNRGFWYLRKQVFWPRRSSGLLSLFFLRFVYTFLSCKPPPARADMAGRKR